MGKYIGIDLGTTFSAMAYVDEKGNPKIITNREGGNTTPSAVLFENGKTVVGKVAKKKSTAKPAAYEAFVKRHMGESTYSFTSPDGDSYRAEEISAIILKKLKNDAEAFLGEEVLGAVITVPAYFGDLQRDATKDAAQIAGLNVLGIINEPTAAAIAFGVSKDIEKPQKIMVYDFGGGTFDVSILDIDNGNIRVISTNGDYRLGGCDVDKILYNLVVEAALDEGFDIERNPKAKQKLMIEAEEAKKTLSSSDCAEISLEIGDDIFDYEVKREDFEAAISGLLDTTVAIMVGALGEAGLEYTDIVKILLVGGSTRIPAVANIIRENTGITPSSEVHPDEAVAIGAAFHALELAKRNAENPQSKPFINNDSDIPVSETQDALPEIDKRYTFKDVTSHGVGIVVWNSELEKNENSVLMPKNTEIPAEIINDDFGTSVPYQEVIALKITQGEFEDLNYVTVIGEAELKLRPRNKIIPIRFIVSCDENQIIHVRAIDMDEHIDLGEVTINRDENNMSDEEVKKSSENIHKLNIG